MKYLKNISYLRVFACLGVVCTHLGQRLQITGKAYELTHYMQYGVYLFFILSGFLALYTYSAKKYTVWKYWLTRLLKILPVYYAIIIYDFIVHGFFVKDMPPDSYGLGWLRYVFIIGQYVPGENVWRNLSFTWTIGIFVLFYLLAPLINKLMKSYRASLVGLAAVFALTELLNSVYKHFEIDREWFSPLFYIVYFMFGVVACRAVQEHKANNAALLMSLVLLWSFAFSKFQSLYTVSALFTVILLVSCGMEFKNEFIEKAFSVLDSYSYEIYLGHAVVMDFIDIVAFKAQPLSRPMVFAVGTVGTVLVSVILYYGVDRPVNKLLKKCPAG